MQFEVYYRGFNTKTDSINNIPSVLQPFFEPAFFKALMRHLDYS